MSVSHQECSFQEASEHLIYVSPGYQIHNNCSWRLARRITTVHILPLTTNATAFILTTNVLEVLSYQQVTLKPPHLFTASSARTTDLILNPFFSSHVIKHICAYNTAATHIPHAENLPSQLQADAVTTGRLPFDVVCCSSVAPLNARLNILQCHYSFRSLWNGSRLTLGALRIVVSEWQRWSMAY